MYLIDSDDQAALLRVVEDIDNLDDVEHLDLGDINTLALLELAPDAMKWPQGKPLVFNEEQGLMLIRYSTDALAWFQQNLEALEEFGVEAEAVSAFCAKPRASLHCLDSF